MSFPGSPVGVDQRLDVDHRLDVVAIGNAIVDVLVQADDRFLDDHGLTGALLPAPHADAQADLLVERKQFRRAGDDDERFDAYVTGELAAMSQPIRAVKAVSGQGDEGDILLVRRVRWGTAAILTATGAAVLGIGAVVLLVVALLTDTLV
jgi:hypothetical protein